MAEINPADYEEDMIDLGHEASVPALPGEKPASETRYPSLFISDVKELDNLPDGEFYFIAKAQVTRHTEENPVAGAAENEKGESEEEEESEDESTETPGSHCSCEITVLSMKPLGDAAGGDALEKDSGDKLNDALDSIAKKKADTSEDMADQGADETTEE